MNFLSEICGAEMLFIYMFGHDVQQLLPLLAFNRTLLPTNHDVCLFATSLDNAFHPGKSLHRQMKTDEDSCFIKFIKVKTAARQLVCV